MVEGAALEKQYTCKGIEGSNPSLSAIRRAALAHGKPAKRLILGEYSESKDPKEFQTGVLSQ